jgi:hypothetical protein
MARARHSGPRTTLVACACLAASETHYIHTQEVEMPPATNRELTARLSKRLANFKLTDAAVKRIADQIVIDGLSISKFNPCIYGICVDYFTDRMPSLEVLSPKKAVSKWEVFPYGIIDWDRFHVRVAFQVDELEGRGVMGEFGR